jgi:hypothetical protein
MKLFFAIIIAITTAFPVKGEAVFSFIGKTTYKFPDTKEGVLLTHTYKFKNIGNEPLIISNYKVACSCTKVDFPKAPVMPNQTAEIKVSFDTNGKYGYQDRVIYIYSNAKKNPVKLRFKVYVYNIE